MSKKRKVYSAEFKSKFVIDGVVKSTGKLLSVDEIVEILKSDKIQTLGGTTYAKSIDIVYW